MSSFVWRAGRHGMRCALRGRRGRWGWDGREEEEVVVGEEDCQYRCEAMVR